MRLKLTNSEKEAYTLNLSQATAETVRQSEGHSALRYAQFQLHWLTSKTDHTDVMGISLRPCDTEVKQNIIGLWHSILFRFLAQEPRKSSFSIQIRSVNKLRPIAPGARRRSLQVTSSGLMPEGCSQHPSTWT
jgi:hypothetical protein